MTNFLSEDFALVNDPVFLKVFGEPGCEPLLKSLVNAAFEAAGFPLVMQLTLLDPRLFSEALRKKDFHLDLLAKDECGREINVEIQTYAQKSFLERTLAYWARLYSKQLVKGHEYEDLKPVVCLNILDYKQFKDEMSFRSITLPMTTHFGILYLELPKIKQPLNNVEVWGKFIREEGRKNTDILQDEWPVLKEAHHRWEELMAMTVEEIREMREWRESCDAASRRAEIEEQRKIAQEEGLRAGHQLGHEEGLHQGIQEGIQEGIQQGQTEALRTVAAKMKSLGLEKTIILQATGISEAGFNAL